jgi:hypothetical protein
MSSKYHWTHTVHANRAPGTPHLCREEVRTYDDGTPYVSGGTPVCGARPWAYSGPAADAPNKCARCLAFEKTLSKENRPPDVVWARAESGPRGKVYFTVSDGVGTVSALTFSDDGA